MTAHTPIQPDPARLHAALAGELRLASRLLADLAYELGSDPQTLRTHMTSLQTIDHITQIQLTIASLLEQPQPDTNTITLHDMAERVRDAVET